MSSIGSRLGGNVIQLAVHQFREAYQEVRSFLTGKDKEIAIVEASKGFGPSRSGSIWSSSLPSFLGTASTPFLFLHFHSRRTCYI